MQNTSGLFKGFFPHPRAAIGIDLDARKITAAELKIQGAKLTLERFHIKEFPAAETSENLKAFLTNKDFSEYNCIGAVSAEESFFKGFTTKSNIFKDKKRIPSFLTHQSLPLDLGQCYWDYLLVGNNLNLVAARKEIIDRQFNAFKQAGIQHLLITAVPFALYNVFTFNYPDKKNFCIVHIRGGCSNLFIFEQGRFWIHTISIGKEKLTQLPESGILNEFAREIKRLLNSHYLQIGGQHKAFDQVYLSGELIGDTLESLSSELGLSANYLNPLQKITTQAPVEKASQFSLSIGLCISCISPSALKLNLLKEKQKTAEGRRRLDVVKKAFLFSMIALLAILGMSNLKTGRRAGAERDELKAYKVISEKIIPAYKLLLEEEVFTRERLGYLEEKVRFHNLWLKILKDISLSKAKDMRITSVDAQSTDNFLVINLAGTTSDYSDINDFLSALRKEDYISGVKIIASSQSIKADKQVDFKVRLDIEIAKEAETDKQESKPGKKKQIKKKSK